MDLVLWTPKVEFFGEGFALEKRCCIIGEFVCVITLNPVKLIKMFKLIKEFFVLVFVFSRDISGEAGGVLIH